jgi:hypothetical protein
VGTRGSFINQSEDVFVNTAIEVKLDNDTDGSSGDRRRGMALVGVARRPERKESFTISVAGDIFSSPDRTTKPVESKAIPEKPVSSENSRKLFAAAAGIAVAGAILIGYLVGRQRK